MSRNYKVYNPGEQYVRIKATGQVGEVYERLMHFVSVFFYGSPTCFYYKIEEVEFI